MNEDKAENDIAENISASKYDIGTLLRSRGSYDPNMEDEKKRIAQEIMREDNYQYSRNLYGLIVGGEV